MNWIKGLERRFGKWAFPNLIVVLLVVQVLVYALAFLTKSEDFLSMISLRPDKILFEGEIWRLFTYIFLPPAERSLFFAFFMFYLYYMMGTALESQWGAFRFNLFVFTSIALTILLAFIPPLYGEYTNEYIMMSMFFAFAMIYPNMEFLVFFILPVKAKWLALIPFIFYCFRLFTGDGSWRQILAIFITLYLFFHEELRSMFRGATRKQRLKVYNMPPPPPSGLPVPPPPPKYQAQVAPQPLTAFHRCNSCGATEQSHPGQDFRYCPECDGLVAYCRDHIRNHIHKRSS